MSRNIHSTSIVTTRHGVELFLHRWQPAPGVELKARIALVHGLGEHAGRYDALAIALNATGVELIAIDLRGHGKSSGRRVSVRYFVDYLRDADVLLEACAATPPTDLPLFLMGHSMGGTIAALYAAENTQDRKLAGLILSSPALTPGAGTPRWKAKLSRLVALVAPRMAAFTLDPALLSRAPGVVEAYKRDPLVHHGPVPVRTAAQILAGMERVAAKRGEIELPLLIFHGTADAICDPAGSRDFEAHVGSTDSTLAMHEASAHETLNDLDRDRVIRALIDWTLVRADYARTHARD
ncbi:alpha/beta fold family hydrolase [Caballeronia hypogeia]|uniref:Monoacylglycerol lipase n=1 Tax=Caballeronia hypogeia TaxID=1777140 RepID=A0A158BMJ5_9BURK|nr:alpha/beta hydrolase [Caballeronia hypogeia]SAK71273.1 alpha/beta fold family hydrolase [Caballeronia hypogeia]